MGSTPQHKAQLRYIEVLLFWQYECRAGRIEIEGESFPFDLEFVDVFVVSGKAKFLVLPLFHTPLKGASLGAGYFC